MPASDGSGDVHRMDRSEGATDYGTLVLFPRNASWANVWIEDEKVWEHRGQLKALEVLLPPGSHRVHVMDFRDQETWGIGILQVRPGGTVTLQFSKTQQPTASDPDVWAAGTP